MTEYSNVDLLGRAAALMRERAKLAADGPWTARGCDVTGRPSEDGSEYAVAAYATTEGDAAHIASLHPAVAVALANWLDETATIATENGGWVPGEALVVARAYLGDAS